MAVSLVLEDGTGVPGANTYVSQANAVTYATNWGYTAFTGATSQTQINALYYATYAVDKLYGRKYISVVPPTTVQGLLWPRYTIMGNDFRMYAQNAIPQCLQDAVCELAYMQITGTSLFPNESDNRLMKDRSVQVGSIKQNAILWQMPTDVEHYDGFRKVELILEPILEQENNNGARMGL